MASPNTAEARAPDGVGQALVTGQRGQRAGEQEPAHLHLDAGQALDRPADHRLQPLLDRPGVLLGDHAPVEAER